MVYRFWSLVIERLGFGDSLQIRLGAALMIRSIFKCFSSLRVATCCLASLAAIVGSPAIAATLTWDPAGAGGGDGSWNTTDSSWDNAGTPQTWVNAAGDTAIFGGTAGTVTLGEAISAAGLQFDTAGYTITANTLTLTGTPAITTDTGVTATIASTLAGTDGLLKNGDGTLTVSTRATYTGATTVTAGTLTLATPNYGRALATSDITVASGATLDVNGINILYTGSSYIPITLDGGLLQLITGSGGHNHFGPLTLNGGTISGKVTSPFASEYSTFDSDVSVGGTAQSTIQGDSSAYGYSLTSNTRTFTVADTGDASGVDLLISSRLVNGGLVKAGDGTMSLTAANTYNGPTSVTGGTLRISSQMRNTSGMTASNSGTLELGSTNMLVGGHGVAVADSRLLTADGGTLLMNASMDSRIGNVTLTNGGTWTSNRGVAAYDILLANTTAGPATVTVSGTGASTMNGSGGIHLQGVQNFAVADVTGDAGTDLTVSMILANPGFAGGDDGGIRKQGPGTMSLTNAGNLFRGDIFIDGGTLIGTGVSSNTNTALGRALGTRTITVNSDSTLSLVGNNVFGGQTQTLANIPTVVVDGGTMTINTYNVVGNIDLNGGLLTATGGSNANYQTYEFNGSTITVGGLAASTISSTASTSAGMHIAGTTTLTLDVGDVTSSSATDLTISATLVNGSNDRPGTGSLLKTGPGTATLTASNTYSGSTTINAGTLLAGNASAFGTTGTITVNAGGTLGVGDGVDFTGRAFTLNTGGKVWLGDGATIALPDAAALAAWESTNTAGGDGTVADILYGAGGTQPSALTSGWTANPGEYFSDILTLEGTGSGNTYVLSMEYSGAFGDMNIWYRDTVNDPFVPLGTTSLGQQAWNSSFTTPGQYGVDPSTSTVWVVTDHNSQFVVVPEPTSLAALAAAIGGLAVAARYKAGRRT